MDPFYFKMLNCRSRMVHSVDIDIVNNKVSSSHTQLQHVDFYMGLDPLNKLILISIINYDLYINHIFIYM